MTTPEEVPSRAEAAFFAFPSSSAMDSFREAVPVIAEWARKEALREASEAIRNNAGVEDENGICEGVSNWPDSSARTYSFAIHEAIEAVHALVEVPE